MPRFFDAASFGKRIEYWIVGLMLKEGIDCYMPLVDDKAIDTVIRKHTGEFIEVQIKARSKTVKLRDAGLFAAITHEPRDNYYFVFYIERLNTMLIMNSKEFLEHCVTNKSGKNIGTRSIWFNGCKMNTGTGEQEEYIYDRFKPFIKTDFSRAQ